MKSLGIILMLLLIPKVSVSQKAYIDTVAKTVLLDREKVIEIGKIIQNEQALFEENELLKQAIEKLEAIVSNQEQQLDIFENKIAANLDTLSTLQSEIIQGADELLRLEKKNSRLGIYGYGEVGTPVGDYQHIMLGLKAVRRKTILSASINPVNENLVYAIGIGYKIF